jgi:thioredoxin reductase
MTDTVLRTSRDERSGLFVSKLKAHGTVTSRLILLATGVVDRLPAIAGIEDFYGTSIHHCPYCDGWEWRDHPLAIIGRGKAGVALTMKLMNWSTDLVLCTHGPARYSFAELEALKHEGVRIITTRIDHLEGNDGLLERIVFRDGTSIERDAIFFTAPQDQRCSIAGDLGCELTTQHVIKTTRHQETNIPGVYVAGDAARDVHFVIVAAAEGAKAAIFMDEALAKMGHRAATKRANARRSSNAR